MKQTGKILEEIIAYLLPILKSISEEGASIKPASNKWSKKEIIGHLIDSATNNHRRFIMANYKDDLIFEGYQQDDWVAIQNYQNREWIELGDFWATYNLHIAQVIDKIPSKIKERIFSNHSFDQMAWQTVPKSNPSSLDYFIKDYVGHLEHHTRQILPDYQPRIIGTY